MCRADDEQNKEIPEGGEFPRLIVEPGGSEGHQLAEGLAEEFHLPVVEGVSQQQPVGYAPSYQGSEETFGLERLEVVGTYPEDGGKQHELRKKQAAQYNVSENQITVSMIYLEGIENITNDQDWIYLEGADEESYSSLRTRTLGSWEELSVNTTAGKLKSVVESLPGVMCAYVDDQHPRGQGTVDVIVIGTAGAASAELIQQAQQAIDTLRDNYEDYLVKPGEIVYQDVDITLHLRAGTSTTDAADVAKTLISSAMRLSNRSDFNLFLQDDIRYILKSNIPGYRKTVFTSPATDVELAQDKVIVLGNITVQVANT